MFIFFCFLLALTFFPFQINLKRTEGGVFRANEKRSRKHTTTTTKKWPNQIWVSFLANPASRAREIYTQFPRTGDNGFLEGGRRRSGGRRAWKKIVQPEEGERKKWRQHWEQWMFETLNSDKTIEFWFENYKRNKLTIPIFKKKKKK